MSDEDIKKVTDEYDLVALVGKFMNKYDISLDAKDAIKEVCKECFKIGIKVEQMKCNTLIDLKRISK